MAAVGRKLEIHAGSINMSVRDYASVGYSLAYGDLRFPALATWTASPVNGILHCTARTVDVVCCVDPDVAVIFTV